MGELLLVINLIWLTHSVVQANTLIKNKEVRFHWSTRLLKVPDTCEIQVYIY